MKHTICNFWMGRSQKRIASIGVIDRIDVLKLSEREVNNHSYKTISFL